MKVMAFKSGGHYCFLKFAPLVNEAIGNLLERVAPRTSRDVKNVEETKPKIKSTVNVQTQFENEVPRRKLKVSQSF